MIDEDIHRVFQIVPSTISKDTGEQAEEESDEGYTAYFLDSGQPIQTDVTCAGKKYRLTITIESL
jgi:hypothetical protein